MDTEVRKVLRRLRLAALCDTSILQDVHWDETLCEQCRTMITTTTFVRYIQTTASNENHILSNEVTIVETNTNEEKHDSTSMKTNDNNHSTNPTDTESATNSYVSSLSDITSPTIQTNLIQDLISLFFITNGIMDHLYTHEVTTQQKFGNKNDTSVVDLRYQELILDFLFLLSFPFPSQSPTKTEPIYDINTSFSDISKDNVDPADSKTKSIAYSQCVNNIRDILSQRSLPCVNLWFEGIRFIVARNTCTESDSDLYQTVRNTKTKRTKVSHQEHLPRKPHSLFINMMLLINQLPITEVQWNVRHYFRNIRKEQQNCNQQRRKRKLPPPSSGTTCLLLINDPDTQVTQQCYVCITQLLRSHLHDMVFIQNNILYDLPKSSGRSYDNVSKASSFQGSKGNNTFNKKRSRPGTTFSSSTAPNNNNEYHDEDQASAVQYVYEMKDYVNNLFHNVVYVGEGKFEYVTSNNLPTNETTKPCQDDQQNFDWKRKISPLTRIGTILYDCLRSSVTQQGLLKTQETSHTYNNNDKYSDNDIDDRFISLWKYIQYETSKMTHSEACDMIVSIVGLVVLYVEAKSWRQQIIKEIRRSLDESRHKDVHVQHSMVLPYFTCMTILTQSQCFDFIGINDLDLTDMFHYRMPVTMFHDLIQSLSLISNVRQNLLRIAQEQLEWKLPQLFLNEDEALIQYETYSDGSDGTIRCALLSLLELISSSSWADYESQGWLILLKFIVNGSSIVRLDTRSWFFRHIIKYTKEGRFTRSTVQHLQRACLLRILQFVEVGTDGTNRFEFKHVFPSSNERCLTNDTTDSATTELYLIEDIYGLFHLLFSLTCFYCNGNDHLKTLLYSCRQILLSLVPLSNPITSDDDDCTIDVHITTPQYSQEDNLLVITVFQCFALALTDHDCLEIFHWDTYPVSKIQNFLRSKELYEMKQLLPNTDFLGWYLDSRTTPLDKMKSTDEIVCAIQVDLLDLLLEQVTGDLANHDKQGGTVDFLASKLSALKLKRRNLSGLRVNLPTNYTLEVQYFGNVIKTNEVLLRMLVADMNVHIPKFTNFLAVNDMLSAALYVCSNEGIMLPDKWNFDFVQYLRSVWCLYLCLCTEDACVRLIMYLDRQAVEMDRPVFLENSLVTIHAIDLSVRHVRITVLSCLEQCLTCVAGWQYPHMSEDNFSDKVKRQNRAFFDFLTEMVVSICIDLEKGLEGQSGGLTLDTFLTSLTCLERWNDIVQRIVHTTTSVSLFDKVLKVSFEACKRLENILCSKSYSKSGLPAVFKRTMILCVESFPTTIDLVYRKLAVRDRFKRVNIREHYVHTISYQFAHIMDILEKIVRDPYSSTNWDEHLAAEFLTHIEKTKEDSEKDPDAKSVRPAIIRENEVATLYSGLVVFSESLWKLSFCCLVRSFQRLWDECNSFSSDKGLSQAANESMAQYLALQRKKLRSVLQSLSRVFCVVCPSQHTENLPSNRLTDSVTVHATYLPYVSKKSLFILVDRILTGLHDSVESVIGYVIAFSREEQITANFHLKTKYFSLTSWILSPNNNTDFIFGVQEWLGSEFRMKKKASPESARQPSLNRCLDKTRYRVEDLECILQKLLGMMNCSTGCLKRKKDELHSLFNSMHTFPSGTFLGHATQKLNFIKEKRRSLHQEMQLFTTNDNSTMESSASIREPKRRKIQTFLRNRNCVVDQWLQLDRGDHDDDEMVNDAFVDLEDFIVDG